LSSYKFLSIVVVVGVASVFFGVVGSSLYHNPCIPLIASSLLCQITLHLLSYRFISTTHFHHSTCQYVSVAGVIVLVFGVNQVLFVFVKPSLNVLLKVQVSLNSCTSVFILLGSCSLK
jgi:hypothetical protein